jgi:hypothetical protein
MSGFQVFGFKIGIIGEDVSLGRIAAEKFEEEFDGIPQTTNAGFAVADIWRSGDAGEEKIVCHGVYLGHGSNRVKEILLCMYALHEQPVLGRVGSGVV